MSATTAAAAATKDETEAGAAAAPAYSSPKPEKYVGPINWNSDAFRYIKKFACTNKKKATHLSLVGGKGGAYDLHGDRTDPQESYAANEDLLFQALAADHAKGTQPSYLVEMRGELFPPLYDFDMHDIDDTPLEKIVPLLKCVQRVVQRVYPQLSNFKRRAIICTAAVTTKERLVHKGIDSYRMKLKKRGYHLIYPDIVTNQQDALFVRLAVVQALEKEFENEYISFIDPADGERVFCDKYEDLVDPTVITDNGLRMIGAHKSAPCPNGCKRGREWDKDNSCPLCDNWGRIDEGRPYSVLASIDGDGKLHTLDDDDEDDSENETCAELKKISGSFYEALKTLSIRRAEGANDDLKKRTLPDWSACEFDDEVRKTVAKQEGKKGAAITSTRKINENYVEIPGTYTMDRGRWTTVYDTARGFDEVVKHLRKAYFKMPWRQRRDGVAVGETLWKAMGEGIKCIGVDKTKSKPSVRAYPLINFCPNQGRAHTSNRTYLDLYWSDTNNWYMVRPGCYSSNAAEGRDPCSRARSVFGKFEVPVNNAVEISIRRTVGLEKSMPMINSSDLMAQMPEFSPDPERTYTLPTSHPYCFKCRLFTNPKESRMEPCKCASPEFAPPSFTCAECGKMYQRAEKKVKKRRRQMPCQKTVHMIEKCACDKPTAPEELRDTMGPDVIKNSLR